MDDRASFTLDQADEEILTYTASDDALEAAAGPEGGGGGRPTVIVWIVWAVGC
jgi:hypothetical protein